MVMKPRTRGMHEHVSTHLNAFALRILRGESRHERRPRPDLTKALGRTFLQQPPQWILNRTRHAVHKLRRAFKREESDDSPYPWELERRYRVARNLLGVGSFAEVRECTDKQTGKRYALKIIRKKVLQGKEQMLVTELNILKRVNHPNLVSLHDLFQTKDAVYIITDLANGGELYQQLMLKGRFTERDAANLIQQMIKGVAYLHDHDIVHRDLKPENLLFKDTSSEPKLMITDFGLSKILKHPQDILMTACGTPGYVAPEVLLQKGHGRPVDMWSIGVIMYTILCGYTPFHGEDQGALFESIMSGKYNYDPEYWGNISDVAKSLIDRLLTYDPDKRVTAHEALKHAWFESAANVDLIQNVRHNFSALTTFRKAVTVVQSVNRLRQHTSHHRQALVDNQHLAHNILDSVKDEAIDMPSLDMTPSSLAASVKMSEITPYTPNFSASTSNDIPLPLSQDNTSKKLITPSGSDILVLKAAPPPSVATQHSSSLQQQAMGHFSMPSPVDTINTTSRMFGSIESLGACSPSSVTATVATSSSSLQSVTDTQVCQRAIVV